MLSDENRYTAEKFWLAELGAESFSSGVHVQPHDPHALWDLADRAVYFQHANGVFITLQQKDLPELSRALESSPCTPLDTFISAMATKGTILGNGPAYVGYLGSLEGAELPICRVDRGDPRVQTLAHQYASDWDVFGLTEQSIGLFAVVEEGRFSDFLTTRCGEG